jgi:hypothetical protein
VIFAVEFSSPEDDKVLRRVLHYRKRSDLRRVPYWIKLELRRGWKCVSAKDRRREERQSIRLGCVARDGGRVNEIEGIAKCAGLWHRRSAGNA